MAMIKTKKVNSGFSLIELMIVIAVLGLLVGIAIPNYSQYKIRGKRTEGKTALADAAARLERFYSDNNVYAAADDTIPAGAGVTTPTENGYYTITIATTSPYQAYTLTAAPSFNDTQCGSYTLTQAGVKGITGTDDVESCWGR